MPDKNTILGPPVHRPELDALLERVRHVSITEAQLREQQISFAYGNAPHDEKLITKESVRTAIKQKLLKSA